MQGTIAVPRHHKAPKLCQSVTLNVLLVEEVTTPTEGKPIRWLLTTLAMDSFEQAWQCVQWYSLRWLIVGEAFPKGTVSLHAQERLSRRSVATRERRALAQCPGDLLYRGVVVDVAGLSR